MDKYYVNPNAQPGGEHEVHKEGCSHMPDNPIPLGLCVDCKEALKKAKVYYQHVDGCFWRCYECHQD